MQYGSVMILICIVLDAARSFNKFNRFSNRFGNRVARPQQLCTAARTNSGVFA